jgi:flagellin
MSDISLSKAVRSNLLSLQNTASLMAKTQERLATGNKVNSALDNPTNFFTASALNARAGDLNALMDSMANGVQTLQAADNGLTAITKALESMQSVLRQARQDKSFKTESFEISPGATGDISFTGGALGALTRSVGLQNTDLTNTAVGLGSAVTGTPGTAGTASPTSGTASFSVTGPLGLSDDTVSFDITVDGGAAQTIDLNTASLTAAGVGGGDITSNAQLVDVINDQLTGATAAVVGGQIVITSDTDGTGSTVAIGAPAISSNGVNTTNDATVANLGIAAATTTPGSATTPGTGGAASFTWGGAPLEINRDAKIALTATIDGVAQTIEITRADVLKAGNADGTIDSAEEFAAILSSKLDGATASASGDAITITSSSTGTSSTVGISAATVTGTNYNADELVAKINAHPDLKGKVRASNDDGRLRIENQSTQELSVLGVNSSGTITGTANDARIAGNTVRADLTSQFNELRDQLDKLSDDASFNGINLLRGDKLTITFNETGTSSIDIQTRDEQALNAAKLDLYNLVPEDLDSDADIDGLLAKMKDALSHVRTQSSTFGQNLSIVENRQQFTKKMINTLETGAANLTLADMNEEAANLLALQTRQSLSSSSLSLAAQADQSVLQLLQ